jgi:hypothetical protein
MVKIFSNILWLKKSQEQMMKGKKPQIFLPGIVLARVNRVVSLAT